MTGFQNHENLHISKSFNRWQPLCTPFLIWWSLHGDFHCDYAKPIPSLHVPICIHAYKVLIQYTDFDFLLVQPGLEHYSAVEHVSFNFCPHQSRQVSLCSTIASRYALRYIPSTRTNVDQERPGIENNISNNRLYLLARVLVKLLVKIMQHNIRVFRFTFTSQMRGLWKS